VLCDTSLLRHRQRLCPSPAAGGPALPSLDSRCWIGLLPASGCFVAPGHHFERIGNSSCGTAAPSRLSPNPHLPSPQMIRLLARIGAPVIALILAGCSRPVQRPKQPLTSIKLDSPAELSTWPWHGVLKDSP